MRRLTGPEGELFGMIRRDAYIRRDEPVRLSSGRTSRRYFDMRRVAGDPGGIRLLARVLYDRIAGIGGARSVGGLESGSIPLAVAVSQLSGGGGAAGPLSSFYVRKAARSHGMGRRIEGVARSPAVVVDDVVTTGGSALEAVGCLRSEGLRAAAVLTPVYRGTEGLRAEFEGRHGVALHYVFREDDFGPD